MDHRQLWHIQSQTFAPLIVTFFVNRRPTKLSILAAISYITCNNNHVRPLFEDRRLKRLKFTMQVRCSHQLYVIHILPHLQ